MSELDFLAGTFQNPELPKEWKYLERHYFKSEFQRAFLYYYYTFGSIKRFNDHTGYVLTNRWLRKLKYKLFKIQAAHKKAKADFDLEMVALIESGNLKGGLYG